MTMWMFLLGVGLAFIAAVSSENLIEAQDPLMKVDDAAETNVQKRRHNGCSKRCYYHYQCGNGYYCDGYRCCRPNNQRPCSHHAHCPQGWYCDNRARLCKVGERPCRGYYDCSSDQTCVNGKCRKRECYYHNQCKQGYYCASGICKLYYCSSASTCSASQCCYKQSSQARGTCYAWCIVKNSGHYRCDCADGYVCKPHNYYWGKCQAKPTTKPTTKPPPSCLSDEGCQKSHCCSGGTCKPLKKADEWCPHKGADTNNCGCIEGYYCKQFEDNIYWGQCKLEDSGSGLEA